LDRCYSAWEEAEELLQTLLKQASEMDGTRDENH